MTVHAVRVVLKGPNQSGLQTAIDALLNNYSEVLPEQAADPGNTSFGELDPGTATVDASLSVKRVSESNASKADVVSAILNNLPSGATWGGIWYHSCAHDESPPSPCSGWSLEDGINTADIPEVVKP